MRIGPSSSYWTDVLPGGDRVRLRARRSPSRRLTATVLGAAPEQFAGVASAVNNDVARTAGLIAVAVLPPLAGISNADFGNAADFSDGFHLAMVIAGVDAHRRRGARLGHDPPPARRPRARSPAAARSHCALDAPTPPRRLRRRRLTPPHGFWRRLRACTARKRRQNGGGVRGSRRGGGRWWPTSRGRRG